MKQLSFQCPHCERLHAHVKYEMQGRKVRCHCGFVFRLGVKRTEPSQAANETPSDQHSSLTVDDRQPTAEIPQPDRPRVKQNSKRAGKTEPVNLSQTRPLSQSKSSQSKSSQSHASNIHADSSTRFAGRPSGSLSGIQDDEVILDAIPVDDFLSAEVMEVVPLAAFKPNKSNSRSFESGSLESIEVFSTTDSIIGQPIFSDSHGLHSPAKKRTRRRSGTRLRSNIGPIWTLVMALLGTMVMLFLTFTFFRGASQGFDKMSTSSQSVTQIVAAILFGISFLAGVVTTLLLVTSGVVAAIELATKTVRVWAVKAAAVASLVFIVSLLLIFINNVAGAFLIKDMLEESGRTVETGLLVSRLAKAAGYLLLAAVVPIVVTITGLARRA